MIIPSVYWTLDSYSTDGHIRLVRCIGFGRAASLLGVEARIIQECHTPSLLRGARARMLDQPWREAVMQLPSRYDAFRLPGGGFDYQAMDLAGVDPL